MNLILFGDPGHDLESVKTLVESAGYTATINEVHGDGGGVLFCISAEKGIEAGTKESLNHAVGTKQRALALVFTEVTPETDPDLLELVQMEMGELLRKVIGKGPAENLKGLRLDRPDKLTKRLAKMIARDKPLIEFHPPKGKKW